MACYLKELDLTMTEDEYEMFQDIPAKESGSTNEAYGIPYDKFKNYLKTVGKPTPKKKLIENIIK